MEASWKQHDAESSAVWVAGVRKGREVAVQILHQLMVVCRPGGEEETEKHGPR